MKVSCPHCNRIVAPQDVNMEKDMAFCAACNEVFKLSENVELDASEGFDLERPPGGAWYREEFDGFTIGATTRSPQAFFLIPFAFLWCTFAIGGFYGQQIMDRKFHPGLSLVGIPFLIFSIMLISKTLMCIMGKLEVRVHRDEGVVFTGIGRIGRRRRFHWLSTQVTGIFSSIQQNGPQMKAILLDGPKPIRFGSTLKEIRKLYLMRALMLLKKEDRH